MSSRAGAAGAWLAPRRARDGVALRLFAFPFAGGDTPIFSSWSEQLPPEIELCPVQLPGRGRRTLEPAYAELGPLVTALAEALAPALDARFALFGHSLGALVSFELARTLRRTGRPLPCHLLVSGRPAPQLPPRYAPLAHLPDAELVRQLHRRYGFVLPAHDGVFDELLRLMVPTIRSDVTISERYTYVDEEPLACPITAFGGIDDATVTREELDAWRDQTRGGFEVRMIPGGHFYLGSAFLIRFLGERLRSAP